MIKRIKKFFGGIEMSEQAYWWCPNCKEEVDGRNVTNHEFHEKCGHPVEFISPADHTTIEKLQSDNSVLRTQIEELEAEVAELKLILEKLQWVHQSDAYKFESYEGCLVCGSSIVEDHLENCVLNKALSTPTGSKLLDDLHELRQLLDCRAGKLLQDGKYFLVVCETEPYFSSVYDVIRLFEMAKGTWNDEDEIIYQKKVNNIRNDEFSSESLKLLIKLKAENSKLLEKIEAGEKIAVAGHVLSGSADYDARSGRDMVSHGLLENFKIALSAYRAACEGGGE